MRKLGRCRLTSLAGLTGCLQQLMLLQLPTVQQCCAEERYPHASSRACQPRQHLAIWTLCRCAFHRCAGNCCMSANKRRACLRYKGSADRAVSACKLPVYQHCQQTPAAAPICVLVQSLGCNGVFRPLKFAKPYSVRSARPKLCGPGENNQAEFAVQTQRHNVLLEPRITYGQSFRPTVRKVHGALLLRQPTS